MARPLRECRWLNGCRSPRDIALRRAARGSSVAPTVHGHTDGDTGTDRERARFANRGHRWRAAERVRDVQNDGSSSRDGGQRRARHRTERPSQRRRETRLPSVKSRAVVVRPRRGQLRDYECSLPSSRASTRRRHPSPVGRGSVAAEPPRPTGSGQADRKRAGDQPRRRFTARRPAARVVDFTTPCPT
jgi:hypothetical protein